MEATIETKALKAAATYLERRGFEIIEEMWAHGSDSVDIIAREDDDLVFVDVQVRDDGAREMPEEQPDRDRFERIAVAYLAESGDEADFAIRYDIISLLVIGGSKALLRHHRNALSVL
jgi:putative endonuclease